MLKIVYVILENLSFILVFGNKAEFSCVTAHIFFWLGKNKQNEKWNGRVFIFSFLFFLINCYMTIADRLNRGVRDALRYSKSPATITIQLFLLVYNYCHKVQHNENIFHWASLMLCAQKSSLESRDKAPTQGHKRANVNKEAVKTLTVLILLLVM